MSLMDALERKYGRYTVPHLLMLLLSGQVMVFFAMLADLVPVEQLMLHGGKVLSGEVWRLFTFLVVPLDTSPLFFAIGVYVTWLIGSSLESQWGEFRFGLFIGLGWLLTCAASLVMPAVYMGNFFLYGSLPLAFARLFPNIEFLLFFVLPVKVKYIGWVLLAGFVLTLLGGPMGAKLQVLAALAPLGLFFGPELLMEMKSRQRASSFRRAAARPEGEAFHRCSVCGRTDLDAPDLAFRYRGDDCFCEECLRKESA